MEYICYECNRPCAEDNSKHLTGKNESIEFSIHFCHDCYYLYGERWVEIASRIEHADKMVEFVRGRIAHRRLAASPADGGVGTIGGMRLN